MNLSFTQSSYSYLFRKDPSQGNEPQISEGLKCHENTVDGVSE